MRPSYLLYYSVCRGKCMLLFQYVQYLTWFGVTLRIFKAETVLIHLLTMEKILYCTIYTIQEWKNRNPYPCSVYRKTENTGLSHQWQNQRHTTIQFPKCIVAEEEELPRTPTCFRDFRKGLYGIYKWNFFTIHTSALHYEHCVCTKTNSFLWTIHWVYSCLMVVLILMPSLI